MKKQLALILALIVSLSCVFAFAGCDVKGEPGGDTDTTTVLATVGDEKIYLHEFRATYEMYIDYYANYGYDIASDETTLAEFKASLLENMIATKAAIIKAKEAGLDNYTDEQLKELEESIEAEYTSIEEYYRPLAEEQAGSEDEAVIQAKFEELVAEESVNYTGVKMTYAEYMEYVESSISENYLVNLYKTEVVYKDLAVSDDDVKARYDEILEADTKAYTENPENYKDAQEAAELYESIPTAYTPSGYSRILSILISPDVEESETYKNNKTTMTSLEEEYGKLAFEDAIASTPSNQARLKEIVAEYKKLDAANKEEYAKETESYRLKAEEAHSALESGRPFVDVMAEYGEDPDFVEGSIFIEKGVLISNTHNSAYDLSAEVKAEFAKLELGEYSGVFEDEDGYHIIYYLADEPEGNRDISELESFIKDDLLTESQGDEWSALISEWASDTEFVTIDQDLLAEVK